MQDQEDENVFDLMQDKVMYEDSQQSQLNEREIEASSEAAEFMRWHYRLGHMHPKKMERLARCDYLPRKLGKISHHPKCKICQYAKQHRSNHKVKGANKKIFASQYPGQCVSVDQLESSTEGLYGKMKGKLTKRQYKLLQYLLISSVGLPTSICNQH